MKHKNKMLTVTQCKKKLGVTRSAIYQAIRCNRLTAIKNDLKWFINHEDFQFYKKTKWSRSCSMIDGKPLYDKSKGEHSIKEASEILDCSINHVYYACYTNKIPAKRKKSSWVINTEDIHQYKKRMRLVKREPEKIYDKYYESWTFG